MVDRKMKLHLQKYRVKTSEETKKEFVKQEDLKKEHLQTLGEKQIENFLF
jgi:hypothetical protein